MIRNLRPYKYIKIYGFKIGFNGGKNKNNNKKNKSDNNGNIKINISGLIRVTGGNKSITLKVINNKII